VTQLETERLILREQTLEDLDDLVEILCDPKTMAFYPRPFTRIEAQGWIERQMRLYEERGFGLWALIDRKSGDFVGQCGLTPQQVDGHGEIEIGWHVKRRLWRRGYASEAAAACLDHGFSALRLERLISLVSVANRPSAGVARKIGMTPWKDTVRAGIPHIVFAMARHAGPSTGNEERAAGSAA
jgi:RimJ/RimL family protein N-acetyltransferase